MIERDETPLMLRVIIAAIIICMIALALSSCTTSKPLSKKKFKSHCGVEGVGY